MASRSCGIIRLSWMIQTKTLCLDLSAFHFYTNILIEISACWFFTKFPGHVTHRLTLPPYWLNVTHLFVLDFTPSFICMKCQQYVSHSVVILLPTLVKTDVTVVFQVI